MKKGFRRQIHAVAEYRHVGHSHFDAQSRDLREHMRAAHAVFQAPPLPDPDATGTLAPETAATLWEIVSFVGTNWGISGSSSLTERGFAEFLDLKTTQVPSYFTVYGLADQLFSLLVSSLGTAQAALAYLYTPAPSNPPPNWDVVRAWVVQEFINLYVSQGAFREYGWMLFPGFPGGSFDDPDHLPYRPMSDGS